jgi:pimeloyl-ACP methyl ester carboxylesterase
VANFVLVHGGWTGSHGFHLVRAPLRAAGHEVFTPCLTGIGERVHLASPQVDLSTHILDVVNVVLYEDLRDIVLLGFSYGGFVVTGALQHISDRVSHLVYLDAFVPNHGDTPLGLTLGLEPGPVELGQDWLVPGPDREFDDAEEGAWQLARRTPHPLGCFIEPVKVPQAIEEYEFALTYIKATEVPSNDPGAAAFVQAAQHAKSSPAWQYREIPTTHMVASNRPSELVDILLEVGSSTGSSA